MIINKKKYRVKIKNKIDHLYMCIGERKKNATDKVRVSKRENLKGKFISMSTLRSRCSSFEI